MRRLIVIQTSLLNFFRENLISRRPFALGWETASKQYRNRWCYVYLANVTICLIPFLQTFTCCNKDWRCGGLFCAIAGREWIAVVIIVTFRRCKKDITSSLAAIPKENRVLLAQCQSNYAFTSLWIFITIKVRHDLFFKFILIFWIYDTAATVFTFEVDEDIIPLLLNRSSFAPINFLSIIAIFIFNHNCVTQFFQQTSINRTTHITDQRWFMFRRYLSMVGSNNDRPAFIQIMQEGADVAVCLLINLRHPIHYILFNILITRFIACKMTDNGMFLQVNCMIVGENNFHTFIVDHMMQSTAIPISNTIPAPDHRFKAIPSRIPNLAGCWEWPCIFQKNVMQFFWMENTIIINIIDIRKEHAQIAAIFCKVGNKHISCATFLLVAFVAIVDDTINHLIHIHGRHWGSFFLRAIQFNTIIDAILILKNQAWAANKTTSFNKHKFFGILWRIGPASSWLDL